MLQRTQTPEANSSLQKYENLLLIFKVLLNTELQGYLTQRELSVLRLAYFQNMNEEEICKMLSLHKVEVIECFNLASTKICRRLENIRPDSFDGIKEKKEQIAQLKKEMKELKLKLKPVLESTLWDNMKITENADISVRAYNLLKAAEIETFRELSLHSRESIMKYRNAGTRTVDELEAVLHNRGLSFIE